MLNVFSVSSVVVRKLRGESGVNSIKFLKVSGRNLLIHEANQNHKRNKKRGGGFIAEVPICLSRQNRTWTLDECGGLWGGVEWH